MDEFFEEHGAGADIKASQPENKKTDNTAHLKTKIPAPKNFSQGDNSHGHTTHKK